jgi:hypothetical protein
VKVTDLYSEFWTPADEKLFRAQAIASQYSDSTRKKWRRITDLKKYLGTDESAYYRSALAYVLYVQEEMERCADAKAHFAVGVLSMSLMESLLVMCFLERKTEVLITKAYARERSEYRRRKQRAPTFLKLICNMKTENLYRLTREMKLIDISDIPEDCLTLIREANYSVDISGVLKYLQDSRNNVHSNNFVGRIRRMIPEFAVDPREWLNDYHYGFAFVAIRVRNIISKKSKKEVLLVRPF